MVDTIKPSRSLKEEFSFSVWRYPLHQLTYINNNFCNDIMSVSNKKLILKGVDAEEDPFFPEAHLNDIILHELPNGHPSCHMLS